MRPTKEKELTAERLRERLDCDPETYVFKWKVSPNRRFPVGSVAGYKNNCGYIVICIDGRRYLAHHLIRLYFRGVWPEPGYDVDHHNLDRSELSNLRHATRSQNQANKRARADNTSGFKGATFDKRRGKWLAQIMVNKKHHHLGYFDTAEDAHLAYAAAALKHFGQYARFT
jgi:hypothetical protein